MPRKELFMSIDRAVRDFKNTKGEDTMKNEQSGSKSKKAAGTLLQRIKALRKIGEKVITIDLNTAATIAGSVLTQSPDKVKAKK